MIVLGAIVCGAAGAGCGWWGTLWEGGDGQEKVSSLKEKDSSGFEDEPVDILIAGVKLIHLSSKETGAVLPDPLQPTCLPGRYTLPKVR
jgi:hypothetical protein